MAKSGIYKISMKNGLYFYIGSAVSLSKRKVNHLSDLRRRKHCNLIMQRVFNKYPNSFVFEVVEYCPIDELVEREQHYIDLLLPNLNVMKIAGSSLGHKHTQKTIEKLSSIAKERAKSENWINGVSKTWFKKGRVITEENRQLISQFMSEKNPFKGKKHSQETKIKMSSAAKKRCRHNLTDEIQRMGREACKKSVLISNNPYVFLEFKSVTDAIKYVGGNSPGKASAALSGRKNSYKGYIWKYNEGNTYA